jgi:hypothetical protein
LESVAGIPGLKSKTWGTLRFFTDAVSRIPQSSVLGVTKGEELGLPFSLMRLGFFQVFGAVFCKPSLVSMQERECVFDVLLCGAIGGAFVVVTYQVLEF